MGTLSRRPEFKIGDLVLLAEGIPASVYDINAAGNCVYVNWIEGFNHQMHKKAVDISGEPHTWGMLRVERLPR